MTRFYALSASIWHQDRSSTILPRKDIAFLQSAHQIDIFAHISYVSGSGQLKTTSQFILPQEVQNPTVSSWVVGRGQ